MKQKNYQNSIKKNLGKLPIWNLGDLYESPNSQKLRDDLRNLGIITKKFEKSITIKLLI